MGWCSISPSEHGRFAVPGANVTPSLGRRLGIDGRPASHNRLSVPTMMLGLLDAPSLAECINFCGFGVAMPALVRRLFLEIESRNHFSGIGFGACIVILALAALLPADIVVRSELPAKLEHFVAYSGTAVICGFAFSKKPHLNGRYLLLILWAGGLEAAQMFSPGRHAALSDFAVSALGILCGAVVWWLARRAVYRPANCLVS